MINPQRQRELAMQVIRFLDGAPEFPSDLADEESIFVDRLVAVQEALAAVPQPSAGSIAVVGNVLSHVAAGPAQRMGIGRGPSSLDPNGHDGNPIAEAPLPEEKSTETCHDGTETMNEPGRE